MRITPGRMDQHGTKPVQAARRAPGGRYWCGCAAWLATVAVVLGAALGCEATAAPGEEEIFRALDQLGVPYDRQAAQAAAARAIVKAVDPLGEVLLPDGVAELREQKSLIKAEEWPEDICYLRLHGLHDADALEVVERLTRWLLDDKTGVIIDLRGAGGDSLALFEAIGNLLGEPSGVRGGKLSPFRRGETDRLALPGGATGPGEILRKAPVLVLINEETHGASEALCAELKQRAGVLLLGRKTMGDARLRRLVAASEVTTLYIAIAKIVPSMSEGGVEPDITAGGTNEAVGFAPADDEDPATDRPPSEKARQDLELMRLVGSDACLARATDILLALKALGSMSGISATTHQSRDESGIQQQPEQKPEQPAPPSPPSDDRGLLEKISPGANHQDPDQQ